MLVAREKGTWAIRAAIAACGLGVFASLVVPETKALPVVPRFTWMWNCGGLLVALLALASDRAIRRVLSLLIILGAAVPLFVVIACVCVLLFWPALLLLLAVAVVATIWLLADVLRNPTEGRSAIICLGFGAVHFAWYHLVGASVGAEQARGLLCCAITVFAIGWLILLDVRAAAPLPEAVAAPPRRRAH